MRKIIHKIRERIRMLGGVKQISIDAVLPIILLPLMFCVAAINFYFMLAICIVMPLFLGYAQWLRKSFAPRTKFFFMWAFASGVSLWLLFEMTVPLMELLPEENFIFITTLFAAAFCFYKVSASNIDIISHNFITNCGHKILLNAFFSPLNCFLFFLSHAHKHCKSYRHGNERRTITWHQRPMISTAFVIRIKLAC